MTDPHVTKLSSVLSDSPNRHDNNKNKETAIKRGDPEQIR